MAMHGVPTNLEQIGLAFAMQNATPATTSGQTNTSSDLSTTRSGGKNRWKPRARVADLQSETASTTTHYCCIRANEHACLLKRASWRIDETKVKHEIHRNQATNHDIWLPADATACTTNVVPTTRKHDGICVDQQNSTVRKHQITSQPRSPKSRIIANPTGKYY